MKYDIVTIGDAFEDVFVRPDLDLKFDRRLASGKGLVFEFGEKIPLSSVDYEVGGSACNTAVGFARLGLKTAIISLLGDDTPMKRVVERLEEENVDADHLVVSDKVQSGFSVIFSMDGERTIFVYHGVKKYEELKIKKSLQTRWFLATPLADDTREIEKRLIAEIAENDAKLAWNPGSNQIERGANHFSHLLKITSVLFLNREEAIKFSGLGFGAKIDDLIRKFHNFGVKIVVITDGSKGVSASDGEEVYHLDAEKVHNIVDTTGAGDAFSVGFLGALLDEDFREKISPEKIKTALNHGIKNSTSVIKYVGAQKGLLSADKIN